MNGSAEHTYWGGSVDLNYPDCRLSEAMSVALQARTGPLINVMN